MKFERHLKAIGFERSASVATIESLDDLEQLMGVALSGGYRDFMLTIGGGWCPAFAACEEITPFGEHVICSFDDIDQVLINLDSLVTPRNMISIGYGDGGLITALAVAGIDHGCVYSVDSEARVYWETEEVVSRFPNLDESIAEFFALRDRDELPPKPAGYDNCYKVADSFEQFISKLQAL